jgi:hypothetical protein
MILFGEVSRLDKSSETFTETKKTNENHFSVFSATLLDLLCLSFDVMTLFISAEITESLTQTRRSASVTSIKHVNKLTAFALTHRDGVCRNTSRKSNNTAAHNAREW